MVNTKYIAEIGLNHNGDLDLAKKHILSAKESGAHYAKFQTYFTHQRAKPDSQIKDILEQCEFSQSQFLELKQFCDSIDIQFASTAFCPESAELLKSINCTKIKIASFQISNISFLKYISQQSWIDELFVSTGMATSSEISRTALSIAIF